jgi:hypothetical protein
VDDDIARFRESHLLSPFLKEHHLTLVRSFLNQPLLRDWRRV